MKLTRTATIKSGYEKQETIYLVRGKGGFYWISTEKIENEIKKTHLFKESVFKTIKEAQIFLSEWNKIYYIKPLQIFG